MHVENKKKGRTNRGVIRPRVSCNCGYSNRLAKCDGYSYVNVATIMSAAGRPVLKLGRLDLGNVNCLGGIVESSSNCNLCSGECHRLLLVVKLVDGLSR
jgi:hypothetical protein